MQVHEYELGRSTMVQEAKRIMDSRAFDYVMKVLMLLQSAALGILVPVMMGMSSQVHQQNIEFREFKARIDERWKNETIPVRVEVLERVVRKLNLEFVKHVAESEDH